MKRAVEEKEIGRPMLGETTIKWFRPQSYYDSAGWRGTREMDGGVLLNQAIHSIDTLQWLLGGVESVTAYTDTLARDLECEDTAVIAVEYENGALGAIQATTTVKGGDDRTEINGTDGSIVLENRGDGIVDFQVGTGVESHYSAETEPRTIEGDPHDCGSGHKGVIRDFVRAIIDGREPEVPATEARHVLEVIFAAYESAATGSKVSVGE